MAIRPDSGVATIENGEKQPWFSSRRSTKRVLRKPASTANSKTSTSGEKTLERSLRPSPSAIGRDYEIPMPPQPSATHPALRPIAARNASSGDPNVETSGTPTKGIRPVVSSSSLDTRLARPRSPQGMQQTTLNSPYMPQNSPHLPIIWTVAHDRAICVLDARNYTLQQSIRKLRRAFPELIDCVITPMMIDKRLRMLDQIPEIDYFKVGLDFSSKRSNIGGDTTMMDKHSPQSTQSKPLKEIRTPNKRHRSSGKTMIVGKENRPLARSPSVEKIDERPDSMAIFDEILLEHQEQIIEPNVGSPYQASPRRSKTGSKSSSLSKINTTPFESGFVSVRTSTPQAA